MTQSYQFTEKLSEVLVVSTSTKDSGVTKPSITCSNASTSITYDINQDYKIGTTLVTVLFAKISNVNIGDVITFKSGRGILAIYK